MSMTYSAADIAKALDNPAPTPQQRAVIEAPLSPLLVVAGAGSGKTETMASRVVWLVANGHVDPDQVLGLTFTRKAATELAERIGRRLRRLRHVGMWKPPLEDDGAEVLGGTPTVSTYHSYAGRLVREHALRLGVEPESRLLSEAAAWQYANEVVERFDGPLEDVRLPSTGTAPSQATVVAAVTDLAGEMAEHLLVPDELEQLFDAVAARIAALPVGDGRTRSMPKPVADVVGVLRARRQMLPLVRDYLALKRSRDALDFADQMALAARLAGGFPDIGAMERQRFRAILLDEFQDTSEAQLVLLRDLFVARGQPVPVTAVGDPNQSIYGWRGASATTLTRFPREFADAGAPATVLPLSTSWRNDRAILAVANLTSGPLRRRFTVDVEVLRPRPGAGPGAVQAARLETTEEEAAHVAGWVGDRWFDAARAPTGTSAAVLCRKRSQFGPVVDALKARGLPVEVVGLGGLLTTPEVSDIVALLWVVQDPTRGDHLMRLLTGPLCRLGAADLDGLAAWSRFLQRRDGTPSARGSADAPRSTRVDPTGSTGPALTDPTGDTGPALADPTGDTGPALADPTGDTGPGLNPGAAGSVGTDQAPDSADTASLVEALDELPSATWRTGAGQHISAAGLQRLAGLGEAVRRLRSLTGMPLAELVGEAERALGLDIEVLARPEHPPTTARAHLDAFADVAASFSLSADRPTLGGFLSWLDAAQSEERGLDKGHIEASSQAVQVLTVHAAKGLEWDIVAVPGLVEGSFPARTSATVTWKEGHWRMSRPSDKGWCGGLSGVPYDLRGDRDGLPVLGWRTATDLTELKADLERFVGEGGEHGIAEERRLAYVAFTRARKALLLTAPVWAEAGTPRLTSRFLTELLEDPRHSLVACPWAQMPEPGPDGEKPVNPRHAEPITGEWPADPMARRRAELADAAQAVLDAMTARDGAGEPAPASSPDLGDREWDDEIDVLLAERSRGHRSVDLEVTVPRHLSASAVVALAHDPQSFARELRRPMPSPPAVAARRGTTFHAWVEQHFARAAIVDILDLPGSADENPGDDLDLPVMKERFLASEWADRIPEAIEIAVETVVDGIAVRGRIDAVFPRVDGGFTVVDWKTGAKPPGPEAGVRAIQLAAYRLAFARLQQVPVDRVDAAFYYAATGETVWPDLPPESELLAVLGGIPD